MTSEGLKEMFEGDSADTCGGKFPLVSMGCRAEGLACGDPEARTPIGASGNFMLLHYAGTCFMLLHYVGRCFMLLQDVKKCFMLLYFASNVLCCCTMFVNVSCCYTILVHILCC